MHISLLYIVLQLIVCDDNIFGIKYFGRIIPTPRLHLGNKDKELYCHINLRSSFTWTTIPNRKSMNIPKENIVKKVEVKVKGMTYNAFEYTNTLWFSDINNYVLPEYHIYVINLEDNSEDKAKQSVGNGIGLGYDITDEKFSIVHCLYNDGKIRQRKFAIGEYMPDISILFDIEPEIGLARINKDKQREVNRLDLEALEFHNMVREGYHKVFKQNNKMKMVDASKSIEEVFNDVKYIINGYLD